MGGGRAWRAEKLKQNRERKKDAKKNARPPKKNSSKASRSVQEIAELDARIEAGAPRSGSNPLGEKLDESPGAGGFKPYAGATLFQQLPLSQLTLDGLRDAKYVTMTDIQRAALPHALCGRDILGAAKTGSGKTLAFLIPVIEKLYRLRWTSMDGVGALIISPTRELAMQIFDELRKVGKFHDLSGGLLIGGRKDVSTEKQSVNGLNILVCTPGRLLQHMHETVNFDCSPLKLLVLDEADRILDMGFAGTLNQIIAQIPKERQTFLFSATQTRSVQDLARLSLQSPEYLAVHAESAVATPARLQQTVMVVPLDQKIDTLWSFIKSHLRAKVLVFLSSCKQVKFVYEAFKHLRPGVPLTCLHGRLRQGGRLDAFYKFVEAEYAVMFATDIAARGLDFPTVDWVVQADCPEDVATYIHRVGRTARYKASGRSLLLLSPSETKMVALLEEAKIPIKVLKPNEKKIQSVSQLISGLLSKNADLKHMAQRAFTTYLRSVYLQGNKEVFDVHKLPIPEYAASLGLPSVPRVRFLGKGQSSAGKNVCYALKMPEAEHKTDQDDNRPVKDDDEPFFQKKRPREERDNDEPKKRPRDELEAGDTAMRPKPQKPKKMKLKIDLKTTGSHRLVFDDDGNAGPPLSTLAKEQVTGVEEDIVAVTQARYKRLEQEMKKRDKEDRLLDRQRLRDKRHKQKAKLQKAMDDTEQEQAPRLAVSNSDYSDEDNDNGDMKESSQMELDSMSLADQEALALQFLRSQR
ncbi:DEAD-box ATP-dependent RNA helicase 32 [Selaginella moellendorffii]|nr:DEAD-box ATP-dependent RNA helicase 32 [Selaginella moellendorffii]|eukprot:XP_002974028.2 DEAD-box ATP-dependent RNA helicase 32 [Selaginella moellendorffii]